MTDPAVLQHALDGAQAVRSFGMALAHFMAERDGVGDEKCFQGGVLRNLPRVWRCEGPMSMGSGELVVRTRSRGLRVLSGLRSAEPAAVEHQAQARRRMMDMINNEQDSRIFATHLVLMRRRGCGA